MGVAILVISKNGKDLKREIWKPFISRLPRMAGMARACVSMGARNENIEVQVCTLTEPIYKLPLHVRFQDPKIEETLELESIGSEKSSERSIKINETHVKLETTHVPKCPEEVLNTVNAELQGTNAKPDLKDNKKKIKTEPGKAHQQQSVIKGKGKGKGKGHSNFVNERTSLEDKNYQIKEGTIHLRHRQILRDF